MHGCRLGSISNIIRNFVVRRRNGRILCRRWCPDGRELNTTPFDLSNFISNLVIALWV